jgi:hypothetical protein
VIVDVCTSSVALPISQIAREKATEVTFRYQVTLQGLTVVDVSKDPRMGHQVAKIGFTTLAKERK